MSSTHTLSGSLTDLCLKQGGCHSYVYTNLVLWICCIYQNYRNRFFPHNGMLLLARDCMRYWRCFVLLSGGGIKYGRPAATPAEGQLLFHESRGILCRVHSSVSLSGWQRSVHGFDPPIPCFHCSATKNMPLPWAMMHSSVKR